MTKKPVPSDAFLRLAIAVVVPLFRLIYWPRVRGRENVPRGSRAVLAGNHVTVLDAVASIPSVGCPVHHLAKVELFQWRPFGWLFRNLGAIPVDRSKTKNSDALAAAVEYLKHDRKVGVFPESTIRNKRRDELLPFKFGAVAMASRAKAPIVPFAITGRYRPFGRKVQITYGQPIHVGQDLAAANDELRAAIAKLIKEAEK